VDVFLCYSSGCEALPEDFVIVTLVALSSGLGSFLTIKVW
jgi:hypothetical protein